MVDPNRENREVELKFAFDLADADALIAHLSPGNAPAARRLVSVYFDSPEQVLRKAGFSLRVREEGRQWTQTVKSISAWSNAGRGEWETPIDCGSPDLDLLRSTPIGAALHGSALEPLFTVSVERRSVTLRVAGSTVEVSVDKGEATRAARSSAFGELELELKSGKAKTLFAFAGQLRKAFALRVGFTTKADRGFALMDKKGPPGRRFRIPVLKREMTAGAAFKMIALAALKQIAGNAEDLRETPEAEVIHQLRLGARRLRSCLSTFKPIVSDGRMDGIKAELEWLAGELDPARNIDVFLSGTLARASLGRRKTEQPTVLGQRLCVTHKTAYARACKAVEGDRFSALLLDILTWIEVGPWTKAGGKAGGLRDAPIAGFAANALEKARQRAKKQGRRFDQGREARHKLRIRTKTLRYEAEVFDALFKAHPKMGRHFIARIEALLDCLGELNDIATGEGLIGDGPALKRLTNQQAPREKMLIGSGRRTLDALRKNNRFWPKLT
jgi:triphosphatase